MGRSFRLAGLLRFRQAQEEQAAAALARANARRRDQAARVSNVRAALDGAAVDAGSSTALRASAAARASSRSMLVELTALSATADDAAQAAAQELVAAKKKAVSLEKLAERHRHEHQGELLREDQLFLDELATTRAGTAVTGEHSRAAFVAGNATKDRGLG
ncbi:flagellar FliJ family protein [Arthrobacter sp. ERGS1:01]|uniref:flagellar FliJ family protein n=1 Tax=Arthrobacter sp. ERGS1:01 TaxID=1704044 RepID=UPI000AC9EEB9|nr:flagellar FliJ family protein [Arthrobacter sp. ERGS1:01]